MSITDPLSVAGLKDVLARFRELHVWVVGDVMLDEYLNGEVRRISPEAPVQVVNVQGSFDRLGGAANAAHAAVALGARVSLCGVVGDDSAGSRLITACQESGIDASCVEPLAGRPTTRKLRVLAGHHHLLRLDWDPQGSIDEAIGQNLFERLNAGPPPDVLVISDYAKGFLSRSLIRRLLDRARELGIPAIADPKRKDFSTYQGATVITPNLGELREAVSNPLLALEIDSISVAARTLIGSAGVESLLVTLGDRGALLVQRDGHDEVIPATAQQVFDVTGAGDTVAAMMGLSLAAGVAITDAARLANAAAGIVVGKIGTAAVKADELLHAFSPRIADKVLSRDALVEQAAWWRSQGRSIVFTNGCFDLLHVGHLCLLRRAAQEGEMLIVGINSDLSVSRLKGEGRPLVHAQDRAAMLAALDCVDAVTIFEEETPLALIDQLLPDVLVKGADYRIDQIVGRDSVERNGGRVVQVELVADHSTTALVDRIRTGAG